MDKLQLTDLHDYQKRMVKIVIKYPQLGLFLDLGLGKTIISLVAIKRLLVLNKIQRVLIVAPLRVVENVWSQEAIKWEYTSDLTFSKIRPPMRESAMASQNQIHLINYEGLIWLSKQLDKFIKSKNKFPYDMIIFDESQNLKSPSSKRFKLLKSKFKFFKRRYLLTATPVPNSLLDIWSQFFVLDLGESFDTSYTRFRGEYFYEAYKYVFKERHDSSSIINGIIRKKAVKLKATDYLTLPEIINIETIITLPKGKQDDYSKLQADFFLEVGDNMTIEALTSATLSIKLRQFIQGAVYLTDPYTGKTYGDRRYEIIHDGKVKALREIYESSESPFIVAIQFRFELEMIKLEFKKELKEIPHIVGGTTKEEATKWISLWNKKGIKMLVVHPQTVKEGLNLQTGGNTLVFYGLPWSWSDYTQLRGRILRQGQTSAFIRVIHLILENSVDELIARSWIRKDGTQQGMLDALQEYIGENK